MRHFGSALLRRGLLAATAALLPAAGLAQVNIEKVRGDRGAGFSAALSADVSLRSGNTDLQEVGAEVRTDLAGRRAHGFLLGRGGIGWKDGERFSDSGLLHLRAGFPVRRAVELETFVQTDFDHARRLAFRALAGAGPRFTMSSGDALSLAVGTAYLREHEEYDLPPDATHPRDVDVSRWSSYVNLAAGSDRAATSWILYAQPRLDRFDDVRVLSEANLSVAMTGTVDLRTVLRIRWDSEPPDGIEETDVSLVTGVAVRL